MSKKKMGRGVATPSARDEHRHRSKPLESVRLYEAIIDATSIIGGAEARILSVIVRHLNGKTGETWVSAERIAEHAGLSVRKVQATLRELTLAGLVEDLGRRPLPRGRGSSVFRRVNAAEIHRRAAEVKRRREARDTDDHPAPDASWSGRPPGISARDHPAPGADNPYRKIPADSKTARCARAPSPLKGDAGRSCVISHDWKRPLIRPRDDGVERSQAEAAAARELRHRAKLAREEGLEIFAGSNPRGPWRSHAPEDAWEAFGASSWAAGCLWALVLAERRRGDPSVPVPQAWPEAASWAVAHSTKVWSTLSLVHRWAGTVSHSTSGALRFAPDHEPPSAPDTSVNQNPLTLLASGDA